MTSIVVLNKAAIIERCIARVHEEYEGHEAEFLTNFTKQDAIILNIQRAIQACIDLAAHIVKEKSWGIPQQSRDVFELLVQHDFIPHQLGDQLKKIVGFRNVAVHDYQNLNLGVVVSIITQHLGELLAFRALCLNNME
jgi:uncharacterized protein YutE (UPF0331/DUF86 family)